MGFGDQHQNCLPAEAIHPAGNKKTVICFSNERAQNNIRGYYICAQFQQVRILF